MLGLPLLQLVVVALCALLLMWLLAEWIRRTAYVSCWCVPARSGRGRVLCCGRCLLSRRTYLPTRYAYLAAFLLLPVAQFGAVRFLHPLVIVHHLPAVLHETLGHAGQQVSK